MADIIDKRDKVGNTEVKIDRSKFKIKTIAYAAQNLELGKTQLEVTPVESLGYLHGEINTEKEVIEETGIDSKGNTYNVKLETSNTMVAEWLQFGSNRITPPNIRRGERVLLWQYAEEDKYYWTTLGLDDHLRRLETVTFAFSDTKEESTKSLTPENTYYFEIDTHNKLVTLSTAKSDGEEFDYTIQINAKDGKIVITDDINNFILLNSREKQLLLENADGSRVNIVKKSITMDATDSVTINTKQFTVNGKTDINGSTNINGATSIKGSLTNNGTNVGSSHTHGGVQGGRGSTSTPN